MNVPACPKLDHSSMKPSARTVGDRIVIFDERGVDVVEYDTSERVVRILVEGSRVELVGRGTDVSIDAESIELRARTVRTVADEIVTKAERWDLRAGRIFQRAATLVQEAQLIESRAERARFLAATAWDVLTRRATIASEDDTIIDGKRVLLG